MEFVLAFLMMFMTSLGFSVFVLMMLQLAIWIFGKERVHNGIVFVVKFVPKLIEQLKAVLDATGVVLSMVLAAYTLAANTNNYVFREEDNSLRMICAALFVLQFMRMAQISAHPKRFLTFVITIAALIVGSMFSISLAIGSSFLFTATIFMLGFLIIDASVIGVGLFFTKLAQKRMTPTETPTP